MAEPLRAAAPLDAVVVVGGGQVALLAAIALARALPPARVVLAEATVAPDALADRLHTGLSGISTLHAHLGIDDKLLIARAAASHRLAVGYHDWRGLPPFRVGYGAAARDAAAGFAGALPTISAALAQAERFCSPDHPYAAELEPALRWDPRSYHDGLQALARQAGVEFAVAPFARAARDATGEVNGVVLKDGTRLTADLIVDASGPDARVHCAASAEPRIDWSAGTPIDRLSMLTCPESPRLSLNDQVSGSADGYMIKSPGRDGTHWWHAWSSRTCSDEDAQQRLAQAAGGVPVVQIELHPSRAAQPWAGRVVAIGDAAATFEPLGWANLHLAAWQILLLLELLPGKGDEPVERAEYNRRAILLAEHAHDFVAAHHPDGNASATLALRRDQFAHRGWLPNAAEDSISLDLWAQLFIGQQSGPGPLPRLMAIGVDERRRVEDQHRRRVAAALASAPPYPIWLREQFGIGLGE